MLKVKAAAPKPTVSVSGSRMMIFDTTVGVFLVDNNTGRVWRYTQLTLSDSDLQPYVDTEETLKSLQLGRDLTPQERSEIRQSVRERRQAANNPCEGTRACFLEVDRAKLTVDGWTSEVVKKQ
ncbi:MAG: hypothetical protein Q7R30_23050 [Acidobacteriota bacterium]|nr:hypothetical protein [Acidobacteriota bacterium]